MIEFRPRVMRCGVLVICGLLAACENARPVEKEAVATSVQPEYKAVGSGLTPSFEAPATRTLPVWRWMYDPDEDSNSGMPQDSIRLEYYTGVYLSFCRFIASNRSVKCVNKEAPVFNRGQLSERAPRHVKLTRPFDWEAVFEVGKAAGAGQIITDGETLYVSYHSRVSPGARLAAYDLVSGTRLWDVLLEGVEPIEQAHYRNETFLEFGDAGSVLVFGKETSGGYVERRDAKTGELLANRTLPAWAVNQQWPESSVETEAIEGSYESRESEKYPNGKERVMFSEDGDMLALHVWQEPDHVNFRQKLSGHYVRYTIHSHHEEFVQCARLPSSERFRGEIYVRFTVSAKGTLSDVSSLWDYNKDVDPRVLECVLQKLAQVEFDRARESFSVQRFTINLL